MGCCCPFSFSSPLILFHFTLQIHLIWFVFACHFLIWLLHILSVYYKACEYISYSYLYLFFAFFATFLLFCLLLLFFLLFLFVCLSETQTLRQKKGFSTSWSKCTFVILVRVECTPSDMLVSLSLANDFRGRIYATGNPQACFELGTGQSDMTLRIPLGTECGTVQQVWRKYTLDVDFSVKYICYLYFSILIPYLFWG